MLIGHENTIVSHFSVGKALLYADANGTYLPQDEQIDMADDSIYDLASLTKLFTTILALDQIGQGKLNVNETVVTYLPEFAANNKSTITIEQLMTHTSGFDADPVPPLYPNYTTYDERKTAVITQAPINAPGTTYLYSDLNFMNLGFVLETITGKTLDSLLEERLTGPLCMKDTFYNRGNVEYREARFDDLPEMPLMSVPQYSRMVAEEFQIEVLGSTFEPPRPQPVRGT